VFEGAGDRSIYSDENLLIRSSSNSGVSDFGITLSGNNVGANDGYVKLIGDYLKIGGSVFTEATNSIRFTDVNVEGTLWSPKYIELSSVQQEWIDLRANCGAANTSLLQAINLAFTAAGSAGSQDMDSTYNNGSLIAADSGAVQITGSGSSTEALKLIVSGAIEGLIITNNGTGASIELDGSASDYDIFSDSGNIGISTTNQDINITASGTGTTTINSNQSFAADGIQTMSGAARVTRSVYMTPQEFFGCEGVYNGITMDNVGVLVTYEKNWRAIEQRGNGERSMCAYIAMPEDYESGTTIEIETVFYGVGTATGNAYMHFGWVEPVVGSTMPTETGDTGTYTAVAAAVPATQYQVTTTSVSISGTGLSAGDFIQIVVFREGTNAADTYVGRTYLLGLSLNYTANKLGTAGPV